MDQKLKESGPKEHVRASNQQSCHDGLSDERRDAPLKVKHFIKAFSKYLSGKKLYTANNPILANFARELENSLRECFQEQQELVLAVNQFRLEWDGEKVYENTRRDESIAFTLYKDGIGEVTFRDGVSFKELDTFIDLLIHDMRRSSSDEDIVTRLWKADFDYITYRVLDEYLSGEFGDGKNTLGSGQSSLDSADHAELIPIFKDKGRVIVESNEAEDSLEYYFRNLHASINPNGNQELMEEEFEELLQTTFKIGSHELKLCGEELLREKRKDSLMGLLRTMLEFSLLSNNQSVLRDIANIIEKFADYFINLPEPARLCSVLEIFMNFTADTESNSSVRELCLQMEKKLTTEELLTAVSKQLDQRNAAAKDVLAYFRMAGDSAVPVLVRIIQTASNSRLRRELCDCLVDVSGDSVEEVIENMLIEKWEAAEAAVYMVNKSGLSNIPQRIRELIFYPDIRVREELVKYLGNIDNEHAIGLLLKLAKDDEKKIRLKAFHSLEGKKSIIIKKFLHSIAFTKEFTKKDQDEKELTFRILGYSADEETLDKLKEMIQKRGFMQGGKNRENKLLAVRALENINIPGALPLLEELSLDSSSLISTRAKKALVSLRKG